MKHTLAAFLAMATLATAAPPAPYPVSINSYAITAPALETYRANARTFRVQFVDGATAANLSGLTTNDLFLSWSTSPTSASRVAASAAIVNATNGQVDFTFTAADLNYAQGRYLYECGISGSVVRQGVLTILGSPYGAGAGAVSFGTNVNWSLIQWSNLPDYITDAPADANQYARKSNAWVAVSSGAATNGINSVTNSGDAVTASLAANVLSVVSTNAARLRVGRLSPIYGIGTTFSDGGHAAINNMNTRIDLRSTNRLHDVIGVYANNSTGMFPNTSIPGVALWNYGETATEPFAAGTRTASLSFGLHNATSAPAMWRLYGVASGTNDMVGDLLFTSQDQLANIFERARITYDGGIVASGTVTAAKGFTLAGSNITAWSQIGGGGGSGTLTTNSFAASATVTWTSTGGVMSAAAAGGIGDMTKAEFVSGTGIVANAYSITNIATDDMVFNIAYQPSSSSRVGDFVFNGASASWSDPTASSFIINLGSGSGTSGWFVVNAPSRFFADVWLTNGTFYGDGSGLTSLKAANIASNTPIQLGTGTVTAAAFIGNGAGLTNLPSSGGAATAGVSAVNIKLVAPAQGITNATFTQVRASTTLTNVGGYYNTNTFSATLPIGSYLCGGSIGALVYTNRGSAICSLRKNGTEFRRFFRTGIVSLPAGDTVLGACAASTFDEAAGTNIYDFAMYFDGGQGITNASTEATALWWIQKASP